jgi:hypothetical protein
MYSIQRTRLARLILSAVLLHACASLAQSNRGSFDHLRTTFPLTGVHAVTPCENCHVGGQMAGTPRQCEYCHRPGSRIATTFKPANHVQTTEACNNCHRSAATWQGARYSHTTVAPGTCVTCHTGFVAPGKPANHIATSSSCDSCHRTVAWVPAGFNHVGVAPGTCMNCHNGSTATGKPSNHVVTTQSCDACHKTTAWLPAGYDHTGVVPGTCGNCHTAGPGMTMAANHIPWQANLIGIASGACDACHTSTTSFLPYKMNHGSTQGNGAGWCKNCHSISGLDAGSMTVRAVTHQQRTPVPTDCTQSGCHRVSYSVWAN